MPAPSPAVMRPPSWVKDGINRPASTGNCVWFDRRPNPRGSWRASIAQFMTFAHFDSMAVRSEFLRTHRGAVGWSKAFPSPRNVSPISANGAEQCISSRRGSASAPPCGCPPRNAPECAHWSCPPVCRPLSNPVPPAKIDFLTPDLGGHGPSGARAGLLTVRAVQVQIGLSDPAGEPSSALAKNQPLQLAQARMARLSTARQSRTAAGERVREALSRPQWKMVEQLRAARARSATCLSP